MSQTKSRRRINVEAGLKWCPKCETRKPVDAFGVQRGREDGLTGWCRMCRAARSRWRRANDPAKHRAEVAGRAEANRPMWAAKEAVRRAIKSGRVVKPASGTPCACGRVEPLEAHHHMGYSHEHRLDVVWRCRSCRAATDAQLRASEVVETMRDVLGLVIKDRSRPTLKPKAPRWASHGTDGVSAKVG